MVKSADTADLKSADPNRSWGFKSPSGHHDFMPGAPILSLSNGIHFAQARVRYTIPYTHMENTKQQLKAIIIQGLRITDRGPESLKDDEPLLGGDLGIDSIDILQLILEIERHFGIKLVDGEFDKSSWESIDTLAATVEAKVTAKDLVPTLQA